MRSNKPKCDVKAVKKWKVINDKFFACLGLNKNRILVILKYTLVFTAMKEKLELSDIQQKKKRNKETGDEKRSALYTFFYINKWNTFICRVCGTYMT